LKSEHAEQIFVSQLAKIFSGKSPSSESIELFGSLMGKCPRPTEEDLNRLFEEMPNHPDAVLPLLKVLCKQSDHQVK
jgi:hypothetical protein